jgi:hypothetical protein
MFSILEILKLKFSSEFNRNVNLVHVLLENHGITHFICRDYKKRI